MNLLRNVSAITSSTHIFSHVPICKAAQKITEVILLTILNDSQRKTYSFIQHYVAEHGYAPKLPEIAKGIGIRSTGVVHRYVQALVAAGLIEIIPHRHRGIQLTHNPADKAAGFPLLGNISAGKPIEAITQPEQLNLTELFSLNANLYALTVKGDSMIDEGILDGDKVICEQRNTARDGEIVVALIDQQEATLKRIKYNPDGSISLIAANPNYPPMTYSMDRVIIQGIFRGLIRVAN
ncbi:transcriptional repressor LexA [soil metagenome]